MSDIKVIGYKKVALQLPTNIVRASRELARYLRNFQFEFDDQGRIVFSKAKLVCGGEYTHWAPDGKGFITDHNLLPTEGRNHLWSVVTNGGVANGVWYIAIYGANVAPAESWTAANFASNSTELTTQYTESTRVEFVDSTPASGSTNNTSNKAVFTSSTDNVNIYGAGLLSASAKGSTSGTLLSAAQFAAVRNLPTTGDTLSIDLTLSASNP